MGHHETSKTVSRHTSDRKYPTNRYQLITADFPSTGRFRILVLISTDLLDSKGVSSQTLNYIGNQLLPSFPSVIEQVVLHPHLSRQFNWKDIPSVVKHHSEMRFYNGSEPFDGYKFFGVDPDQGALAVVRPDGYVGIIAQLGDVYRVEEYLAQCVRKV